MSPARAADPAGEFAGFGPEPLRFLRGLARNNRREWFEERRALYESALRRPMAALVEEMDARFATLAPEIVGDRRSMFRIHRDVRFSADKSPYKTHVAAWFYHRDAGRAVGSAAAHGGAGFYFHLEPGASMLAAGIWMPPKEGLALIRKAIAEAPNEFESLVTARALRTRFAPLSEEAVLTRVPRGFAADHPAARWLRFKSFTRSRPLSDAEATAPELPALLARDYRALLPLVRWLNDALGFPAAAAR